MMTCPSTLVNSPSYVPPDCLQRVHEHRCKQSLPTASPWPFKGRIRVFNTCSLEPIARGSGTSSRRGKRALIPDRVGSSNVGPVAMRDAGGEIEADHHTAPARAAHSLRCTRLRIYTGSRPSWPSCGPARPHEHFGRQLASAAAFSRPTSSHARMLLLDTALGATSARFAREGRTHARPNLRWLRIRRPQWPGGRV